MSSAENNINAVTERKIRFRPDAHVLFSTDNKSEDTTDSLNGTDYDTKKKGTIKIISLLL